MNTPSRANPLLPVIVAGIHASPDLNSAGKGEIRRCTSGVLGRSQAVRLPKAFRFKEDEVKISKKGDRVILEPLERSRWPEGFWVIFPVDPDFKPPEAAAENYAVIRTQLEREGRAISERDTRIASIATGMLPIIRLP